MHFLQVSQARSGTHMLRSVFMFHPDIRSWHDFMGAIALQPCELPRRLETFYNQHPGCSGAMTHFMEQPLPDEHWEYLRRIHDKMIVLTRKDSLRRFLSKKLAQRSGSDDWSCSKLRVNTPAPFRLDLGEYVAWVSRTEGIESRVCDLLRPYHHVAYEDLVDRQEETLRGIYTYLDLRWDNPRVTTFVQETRPVNEIITNYEEVAGTLAT